MTDIFISYARADRDRVRNIALALTAEGFAVWWDPDIKPGKQWNDVIRKALDDAAAVVVCWSPTSAKSNWVAAESNHANARRALVPVMVKSCNPPIPFNMIQSADLTRWRGDPDHAEWVMALREIRRLVEAKRRGIAAAPPPGEAEGATMSGSGAGAGYGAGAGVGGNIPYQLSRTRGRMGPRLSQMLLSTVVIGAVLTAGIVAASNIDKIYRPPPAIATRVDAAPEPSTPTPTKTAGLDRPSAPKAPRIDRPAPPETEPEVAQEPDLPPEPERPSIDDRADVPALEQCIARLAASCPAANGSPVGFHANNSIDPAERRFLAALGVSVEPRINASANNFCNSRRPSSRPVRAACDEISFPREERPNGGRPPREQTPRANNNGNIGAILGGILGALVVGAAVNEANNRDDHRNDDKPPPSGESNPPRPRDEAAPRADTANPGNVQQQPGGVIYRRGAAQRVDNASLLCATAESRARNPNSCPQDGPIVK